MTGMSSGVELPPRCRSWATTAGRPTFQVARARLQKTILGWREPLTPEPTPAPGAGGGTPSRVPASERSPTLRELVTLSQLLRCVCAWPGAQAAVIHVEHQDVDGQPQITVFGLVAHEIDHLRGILYRQRMRPGVEPIPLTAYRVAGATGGIEPRNVPSQCDPLPCTRMM
jgi:hypothetical protein